MLKVFEFFADDKQTLMLMTRLYKRLHYKFDVRNSDNRAVNNIKLDRKLINEF